MIFIIFTNLISILLHRTATGVSFPTTADYQGHGFATDSFMLGWSLAHSNPFCTFLSFRSFESGGEFGAAGCFIDSYELSRYN